MSVIWNTAVRFELGRRYFTWKEQKLQPGQRLALEICVFVSAMTVAAAVIMAVACIL